MLPRDHYLKQTFQDSVNFPDGFEKGGLSDIQARLVRKQGVLINALMQDEVADPSNDDLHILKAIANQSSPKSPAEQAWIKYLSIIKARQAAAPAKTSKTKVAKAKPSATDPTTDTATDDAKPAKAAAKKTTKAAKTD